MHIRIQEIRPLFKRPTETKNNAPFKSTQRDESEKTNPAFQTATQGQKQKSLIFQTESLSDKYQKIKLDFQMLYVIDAAIGIL